jgi:hypothetical protein
MSLDLGTGTALVPTAPRNGAVVALSLPDATQEDRLKQIMQGQAHGVINAFGWE